MVDMEKEMIETLTKAYKYKGLSVREVKELHKKTAPPKEIPDAHKAWQNITKGILDKMAQ